MGRGGSRGSSGRTTLKDVAAVVGVSVATVSYVINNKHPDRVSAATRRKVLKAVQELNYIPDSSARSLVTRRSQTLGIYIPDQLEDALKHPHTNQLLAGAMQKAALQDYSVQLTVEGNDLSRFTTDGWLCLKAKDVVPQLQSKGTPLVYVDPAFQVEGMTFSAANELASQILISHIRPICKKLIFISDEPITPAPTTNHQRYEAIKEAWGDTSSLTLIAPQSKKNALQLYKSLEHLINPDTMIIASNDFLAIQIIQELSKNGLSVPGSTQITAYGDCGVAQLSVPELTYVDMRPLETGYRAAHLLLKQIVRSEEPEKIDLSRAPSPQLVVGSSTRS